MQLEGRNEGKIAGNKIVLDHFNVKSVAMGVFGGFSGQYIIDSLNGMGIKTLPFYIEDTTRINVFVNDEEKEFKFVGKGGFGGGIIETWIIHSAKRLL